MSTVLSLLAGMTGTILPTFAAAAPSGWLLLNGDSIGKAGSGATLTGTQYRTLYKFLWANLAQTVAPVAGGRGATSQADWDAGKALTMPDGRNRSFLGAGQSSVVEAVASVAASGNAIPVASNDRRWTTGMPVTVSGASGFTGLSNGSYWIIRASATSIQLATSLANAQNGTAAVITGTGSATFTHTFTARTLGESGGEEAHAMSATELLAHTHATGGGGTNSMNGAGAPGTGASSSTGGNAAMNILSPFLAANWIIKI